MTLSVLASQSKFEIGDTVYLLVTPSTSHLFLKHYHPRPYFVLQTTIRDVKMRPSGPPTYTLDTGFHGRSDRIFANERTAKRELTKLFAQETDGLLLFERVRVVPRDEEKREEANLDLRIYEGHTTSRD